jgi:hypothetical protein
MGSALILKNNATAVLWFVESWCRFMFPTLNVSTLKLAKLSRLRANLYETPSPTQQNKPRSPC